MILKIKRKHNKVVDNNTTWKGQFKKNKDFLTEYIPMSSPDSFLWKIPLRASLSQLYIKPWLHKIIIFDEIRKYYGKHKNDNHWVKLQYSRDKNIVLLSRKHKNDIHRVKLQNDNPLGSIIMTAILSNRILFWMPVYRFLNMFWLWFEFIFATLDSYS